MAALGIDHRYYQGFNPGEDKDDELAFVQMGLETQYDLSGAINMDEDRYGELFIGGFVKYSCALKSEVLDDVLYGGLTLGYNW